MRLPAPKLERRIPFRREETGEEAPKRSSALHSSPKRISARQSKFWQREYWDTFMRDEEQERKAIRYIESNPSRATLCRAPEGWAFSSALYRDAYGRLRI